VLLLGEGYLCGEVVVAVQDQWNRIELDSGTTFSVLVAVTISVLWQTARLEIVVGDAGSRRC